MTEQKNDHQRLRHLARGAAFGQEPDVESLSPGDLKILIHEFGVYQVELETQNEELRETRQLLEEAHNRFRELYEFAPVGYLTLDKDGYIREINLAASRLLGPGRSHLVGRDLAALLPEEGATRLRRALQQRRPATLEIGVGTGGYERHLRLDLAPNDVDHASEFRAAVIDETERRRAENALKASEARFRTLADTAPLGIFEADRSGRFDYVNSKWEKITGLPPGKSLGFGWAESVHPEDRRRVAGEWVGRIGEGPWLQEFRLNRPDGSEAWARMLSAPTGMQNGRPTGYVGTLEDITLLRRNEAELRGARDRADDASRAKSEFLANMSHEIRTPMTVVLASLEQLQLADLPPLESQYVEMAQTSATALLNLINDILDFSRIEARKMEIYNEPFEIRDLLRNTLDMFRVKAEAKGVRLELEVGPEVPQLLLGDPDRLRQILINLIGNALKFTESGSVTVLAAWSDVPESLHLCIRDTGIGMEPESRDRLFQSFSQLDSSRTKKYGGTGLGLVISKGLVELMGGSIEVESAYGQGSDFWVSLPLPSARSGEEATDEASDDPGESPPPPARILLAEDDPSVRHVIGQILQSRGWEVVTAQCGEEAVAEWSRDRFDLVLMDVQMPGMDGLEATRKIRSIEGEGEHTPIIALTAYARHSDRTRCLEAGMDAYTPKPITIKGLCLAVRDMLPKDRPRDSGDD